MEDKNPLVSIITPSYNSENFIVDTINSVINQSYTNWELIIVDDASKDTTITLVKGYMKSHYNIILVANETNKGAAITRNKAIEIATGDYIAFLDADDLWKPSKLERQLAFMKSHNLAVCYSSYELINEAGEPLDKMVKALPVLPYNKLLKANYLGNLTGIYNAKALGKITSPNLRKRQDWLLWLKAIEIAGKPAEGIEEPLAYYRVRDHSISSNKTNLLKYNYWVYKKGLGFSTLKSVYSMMVFIVEHFFIKSKQTVSLPNK